MGEFAAIRRRGPVLANYGLDTLRFINPVGIGDTIQARLTCKRKIDQGIPQGGRGMWKSPTSWVSWWRAMTFSPWS